MPANNKRLSGAGGRLSGRWPIVIAGALLLALVMLIAVWIVNAQQPRKSGQAGMQLCVTKVGQLMILPTDETPTYGTVQDKTKLKGQTFFAHAENGDELLMYERAKTSILYRASINKIVNVGPIVQGTQGSPYVTSKIAIENGSGNAALLNKMTKTVTEAFPNATIMVKTTATRTYPTSIVIDLTAANQPLAEQIADSLRIKGGKLPLGETSPDDADILIIIGKDYK
jgi:hypothetical protein